ncbi:ABC transporter C family member 5 [Vitis vinifera]|uniref:ABC transporter C family member 5 n=1 Tax=Vitis vinifera TaxID=29760 RepID=A0A438KDF1_VITVI|nr:ABC transporter C family member 5 [Vitis vinifera]
MIKMINLFNEMEILRVENNGETNIDMVEIKLGVDSKCASEEEGEKLKVKSASQVVQERLTGLSSALDKSQLGDVIRQKEQKLDTPVLENGDNWSVGQRQLVSLGQALLKQATILVRDEVIASVDTDT